MYPIREENRLISIFLFLLLTLEAKIIDFESRIISGVETTHDQFPWQVLLQITGDNGEWYCGGTLIADTWILTAAHCIEYGISIWISGIESEAEVRNFFTHEGYDGLANDIGLVNVHNLNDSYKPIELASEALEADVQIIVSGYGQTSENSTIPTSLHYAYLSTIENSDCDAIYGGGIISDDMLCAVSATDVLRSTCFGDSGGPAVVYNGDNPVLVGIITFVSDRGCEYADPSGFTRVAYHREWIQKKIGV